MLRLSVYHDFQKALHFALALVFVSRFRVFGFVAYPFWLSYLAAAVVFMGCRCFFRFHFGCEENDRNCRGLVSAVVGFDCAVSVDEE